jgi:predicted metalloprotease with PDZ domain
LSVFTNRSTNFMRKLLCLFLGINLSAYSQQAISYQINVTANPDTFLVSADVPFMLGKGTQTYQFAATAPGTYQTQNIGRFVSDFKAFDKKGKELNVKYSAPNQFRISKANKVVKVTYKVAETFDTKVEEYPIYLMCGSNIEADRVLINNHTVFGYFEGYQSAPVKIGIKRPADWKAGTALEEKDGYFLADNFDHAVDSPILLGKLTFAETKVDETPVRIFTYAGKGKITSELLLANMKDMLEASRKFLIKLPVDKYTFLYYFLPEPDGVTGAWEHSYSSEYVMKENDPTPEYLEQVTDIASHEFFHIVTPLNIHSEVIESFNFVKPTPSQHLWLYEGVTEWASNILLYRGGVTDLDNYIRNGLIQKIVVSERYFNPDWSLAKIAEESFNGGDGAKEYGNIYYRGSLLAGYLDILLLDKSNGTRGLREVILELVKKYGKGNPVSEKTFFEDLAAMTYPEVKTFIDTYILKATPFPHAEFLSKIGLQYETVGGQPKISRSANPTERQKTLFEAWSKNLPLK